MHEVLGVRGGEPERDLAEDPRHPLGRKRGLLEDHLIQRLAAQDFHHHEVEPERGDAEVDHLDHVRVIDLGGGLGLPAQALGELPIARHLPVEELDRVLDPEDLVGRPVDAGHPALAEALADHVAIDGGPDQRVGLGLDQALAVEAAELRPGGVDGAAASTAPHWFGKVV